MTAPTREGQLVRAFVSLADFLVSEGDVDGLLRTLVDTCTRLLPVQAAGIMLRDAGGVLQVAVFTSGEVQLVELVQLSASAGPCWQCAHEGRPVGVGDIAAEGDRWPAFRAAAQQQGFRAVHALPMRLRDEVIGTLNLFGTAVGSLDPHDAAAAQALADVATIGIISDRGARRRDAVGEQLQHALDSRVVIEQAKGVLAQSHGVSMEDSFASLRRFARSSNRTIRDVASALVERRLATSEVPVVSARTGGRPAGSSAGLAPRPAPGRTGR